MYILSIYLSSINKVHIKLLAMYHNTSYQILCILNVFYFNSYTSYLSLKKVQTSIHFSRKPSPPSSCQRIGCLPQANFEEPKIMKQIGKHHEIFYIPHLGFPSRQTFSLSGGLFQNSRGSKFIATGWLLGSSLMTEIATGFYVWITGIKDRHILEIYNVLKLYKWSDMIKW